MDFSFSEEEQLIRETTREFLKRYLEPVADSIDTNEKIPESFLMAAGSHGIISPLIETPYGGARLSFMDAAIISEEIAKVDTSMATSVYYLLNTSWAYILQKYGNKFIKSKILPDIAIGKKFIGIASTEASGGSDVAAIKTSGEIRNGKIIINGEKAYISGGIEAKNNGGGHLTLVKTDKNGGHKGISMVYVPADSPGIEMYKINNMGRMGISTCIIRYNNVEIPEENIIGKVNKGFYYAMDGFNHARILVAAACNGLSDSILERGLNYIKERSAFGKKLEEFQGVSFKFSELKTELEMSKLLTYKAAYLADIDSNDLYIYSAMSKFKAPQIALDIVKNVMMWFGAYSYGREAGLEKSARGIFSYLVGAEGALNIMNLIISKAFMGL
ncbi:acyl-CoA dehydrogenase family protein [Acidiplasma sp.]|uniref:acyl-CoA dehydrogenase family protein n=1 Tax=Acidiplasma sp. TaxID=1872114 RepID=UPI00316965E7